jgi:hypothetical protein
LGRLLFVVFIDNTIFLSPSSLPVESRKSHTCCQMPTPHMAAGKQCFIELLLFQLVSSSTLTPPTPPMPMPLHCLIHPPLIRTSDSLDTLHRLIHNSDSFDAYCTAVFFGPREPYPPPLC